MGENSKNEIIVVRSLTTSDMGLFAAHRPLLSSKQRAMNINANVAQILFSDEILQTRSIQIPCKIILQGEVYPESKRHFGKIGKNWRLGGKKINGKEFLQLDNRDFALIRTIEKNDGTHLITILLIARATDSVNHAKIVRLVEMTLKDSMEVYKKGSEGFNELANLFPPDSNTRFYTGESTDKKQPTTTKIPPIPKLPNRSSTNYRTIKEKFNSPDILEQMLKASSDLSAAAQLDFIRTIEILSSQLREVLLKCNRIIKIEKDHNKVWTSVNNQLVAFVDGGLANLSMLGSVPIAARVGGYIVRPGDKTEAREQFVEIKKLIGELYAFDDTGVFANAFPDASVLRDAARISIEAAGAVNLICKEPEIKFLFLHGALVNPVSRYTDIMKDGKPFCKFPEFTSDTIKQMLPGCSKLFEGRDKNFINIYLEQLNSLNESETAICGVVEKSSFTSSVLAAVLNSLDDNIIQEILPDPPHVWKKWFLETVNPLEDLEMSSQRISDALLFRCVLEPGEVLVPVEIDRNNIRKAPDFWKHKIIQYPKPLVSFLQPSEFSPPIRFEIFKKDLDSFPDIAKLLYHCSLLLPHYSFPVGLDIVDKYARIPNWMSRPINTNTAVRALKTALDKGDKGTFDILRRMLCGSNREWFLRPGVSK